MIRLCKSSSSISRSDLSGHSVQAALLAEIFSHGSGRLYQVHQISAVCLQFYLLGECICLGCSFACDLMAGENEKGVGVGGGREGKEGECYVSACSLLLLAGVRLPPK